MNVSINIQPLMSDEKTGIGYYADGIVRALLRKYPNTMFRLDFFAFDFTQERLKIAEKYASEISNVRLNPCRVASSAMANSAWMLIDVPYSVFFGKNADSALFFNYFLPPVGRAKSVLTICDTVIFDCPETMRLRTRLHVGRVVRRSARRADEIVTISQFSKGRIMSSLNVHEHKISVVPCAADTSHFRPIDDSDAIVRTAEKYGIYGSYILYLGTVEPRKNLENLIRSYELARRKYGVMHKLVIAGRIGWKAGGILSLPEALGIAENVIFTGYCAYDDLPYLINGADIFTFISGYEGFGMPVLEAMACGTPVLCSDVSSLPEITAGAAFEVSPDDNERTASVIARMLSDASLREEMSKRGIKRALEFSWDRSAEILGGILGCE